VAPRRVLVVFALVLVAAACVGQANAPSSSPPPSPLDVAQPFATPASDPLLPDAPGTLVARARAARFRIFERPGPGAVMTAKLLAANDWQQPLWLPAIGAFTDVDDTVWYQVLVPVRPNGATGWVRADDVTTRAIYERIVVDLSAHRLWRHVAGQPVQSLRVGVGSPAFPTTPGRFFIWARVPSADPSGPYGVMALGLSGFSEVITDWVGGGRMAIHGTTDPTDRGRDVSHGCVRVFNPQMTTLADVTLGTPVTIRP
jgi:lipoprotein-anchoring transpeptidase ErfK/SrfK